MNSLRQKFASFMIGRYGIDQLYNGLLVLFLIITLLQIVTGWEVLSIVGMFVILYTLFRTFSKNHAARRKENEIFLRFWRPLKTEMILIRDRFRDRKTVRYRHCRHCRAILKLPKKKGSHTVVCPKCHQRFSVHILF